jgi:hypothetical protein
MININIVDLGVFLFELFKNDLKINIYPVIAENSTVFPFATYTRESTTHQNKDSQISAADYNITLVSDQYNESIELVKKVIDACRKIYTYKNTLIRLKAVTTSESYNDAYIQTITVTIEIN